MSVYEALLLMVTFGSLRPGGSPFRDCDHYYGRKDEIIPRRT